MSGARGEDGGGAALLSARPSPRSAIGSTVALLALAIALGVAFHPLFTSGVSVLTGDNATHSLPLDLRLSDAVHGGVWRFWEPDAALGFPIYAEGTAGWFHPIRLAILALVPGIAGHDLLFVGSFFLTGAAAFFVARELGSQLGTALLAALATAFSPVVLDTLYNASYAQSIAWAALCLVGFERWYAEPSRRRFAIFAASVALALLAGYVPTTYALVLFLGVVLAVRIALDRTQTRRLPGFAAALAVGAGLAALQLLPLVELTAHSVRQQSVDVLNAFPWPNFLGGLVFDSDPALYQAGRYGYFAAPLGTVLALVGLPFVARLREPRALSYLAGIAILLAAASGPASLGFDALRALLPGLDRLRLLSPFVFVATVPTGVVLAASLDQAVVPFPSPRSSVVGIAVAVVFALFLVASPPAAAALPWYRNLELALLAVAIAAPLGLRRIGRARLAPLVWLAVLAVEIAVLRSGHRAWLPDSVLEADRALADALGPRLREHDESRLIHFPSNAYRAVFDGMVREHWKSPGYARRVRDAMRLQVPLANLIGGVPCVETSGALPLAGYDDLVETMRDELRGRSRFAPGRRALDRWGVRWLVLHGDLARLPRAPDFETIWSDPAGDLELLENRDALPRFQWQEGASTPSSVSAPAAWRRAIERLPWVVPTVLPAFESDAPRPGRLFAAVPFYPGWTAELDGRAVVPERAADGFGMELPLEAGRHRVELRFVPHAFHLGVLVSIATALGLAIAARRRPSA
jgi:hypothetical protein